MAKKEVKPDDRVTITLPQGLTDFVRAGSNVTVTYHTQSEESADMVQNGVCVAEGQLPPAGRDRRSITIIKSGTDVVVVFKFKVLQDALDLMAGIRVHEKDINLMLKRLGKTGGSRPEERPIGYG